MNKKALLAFILVFVLIGGVAAFFYFRFEPTSEKAMLNPLLENQKRENELDFDWAWWEDPAGFKFEYPQGFEIDSHEEDEVNYAYLEFAKKGSSGKLTVICNDAPYQSINDWLEDELVKEGNSLQTEIASFPAQKVILGEGREVAAFIDQDKVIYLIDKQPEGEAFWDQVYARILSSFALVPLEGETAAEFQDWLEGFDTSSADIIESVEVIE